MDVTIDDKTGLPELPDGYFWEVSKVSNRGYTFYASAVRVSICRTEIEDRPNYWDLGLFVVRNRFNPNTRVEKTVRESESLVWDPNSPVSSMEDVSAGEVIIENVAGKAYKAIHPDRITKSLILMTSEKVIKDWTCKKEAATLFGTYPPKSILDSAE